MTPSWLASYEREWLRRDLVAGATVWAVLIPSALAYASIVGVDPIAGLYTVPLALLGYAVFGGSRLLVVGPDAAISVLAASTLAGLTTGEDFVALTIALTLVVGGVYLLLYLLRMGWVADLVPDPVLKGFIQGLVWVTILDQIPKVLGIRLDEPHDDFWRRSIDLARAVGDTQNATAVVGIGSLVALFGLRRVLPRVPAPLGVLAVTMVAVGTMDLAAEGVSVVGEPDGALFDLGLPSGIGAGTYVDLLPGALAIVVLGFTESMGAAKSAALTTGERLDPNQELLAIGTANIGASVSGGYVVTGALSKTSVAIASGGRTQVGNLFAGVLGVLTILVLRPLFENLANTALAAIVIFAMSGMVDAAYFRLLWKISRMEFLLAAVAFVGVLTFGVLPGVVVAVVLSLVLLVLHIGNPPSSVLGRTPAGAWYAVDQRSDAAPVPGMLVWRQEAPLVFLNARRLFDRVRNLMTDDIDVLVVDASVVSGVDSTGLTSFASLREELEARGVEVWVVHPLARTWARAAREAELAGRALPPLFETLDDALHSFETRVAAEQERNS